MKQNILKATRSQTFPENTIVTIHEFIGKDQLLASDFYKSFLKKSGTVYIMGADLHAPGGIEARSENLAR